MRLLSFDQRLQSIVFVIATLGTTAMLAAGETSAASGEARTNRFFINEAIAGAAATAGEGGKITVRVDGDEDKPVDPKSVKEHPPVAYRLEEAGEKPVKVIVRGETEEAEGEKRTYLGVEASPPDRALREQLGLPVGTGLVIDEVVAGSPAQQAGLQEYDVLQKLDDQVICNLEQLKVLIGMHKADESVKLSVIRRGQTITISAKLANYSQPKFGMLRPGAPVEIQARAEAPHDRQQADAQRQVEARLRANLQTLKRQANEEQPRQSGWTTLKVPSVPADESKRQQLQMQTQLAELELEAAKLQLERQKMKVEETEKLSRNNAASESELKNAQTELRMAEIQVKKAEVNLAATRLALQSNTYGGIAPPAKPAP